jgi:mycoredoxin-dependent peroxiredoxin
MANERLPGALESVAVGDEAPDFELPALIAGVRKGLRLSEYRGQKSVVLAFYPSNWQEASARQLRTYQQQRPRLLASQAETVAITVDSIMNTSAWEREIGPFDFPMCADFWPHGAVCARYGVLRQSGPVAGASERAVFVVNRSGRVVFKKTYGAEETPPLEEVLSVLEKG